MKTTFDLPEPLLRRAKAAAALRGSSLRDLVAEAMSAKLAADEAASQAAAPAQALAPALADWDSLEASLSFQPDGAYLSPNGIDNEAFFEALEAMRRSSPQAGSPDGRAALRAALVRQPGGGYVNLLGYEGPSFDDALALARSAMHPPDLPDFGTCDEVDADSA